MVTASQAGWDCVVEEVSKSYGRNQTIAVADFIVSPGDIVGICGNNGVGKTTLLRLISGQVKPTSGRILINGIEPPWSFGRERPQLRIGLALPETGVERRLTVLEGTIRFMTGRRRADRARRVLEDLLIGDCADRRVDQLSTGQKTRLKIAMVVASDPDLGLLDEPTLGLDTGSEDVVIEAVRRMHAKEKLIVLSTTNLAEAIRFGCRRILSISDARVVEDMASAADSVASLDSAPTSQDRY